jgi:Glycosyltransferase family 87
MNHFTLGIIKIILLEGAIALLVLEVFVKDAFQSFFAKASTVLTVLMALAWANFGTGRSGVSYGYLWLGVPVVFLAAWVFRSCLGKAQGDRAQWIFSRCQQYFGRHHFWAGGAAAVALFSAWGAYGISTSQLRFVHHWEQYHFFLGAKFQRELGSFNIYKATLLADRESTGILSGVQKVRDLTNFEEVSTESALQNAPQVRGRFSEEKWNELKKDWSKISQEWPLDWNRALTDHGNSNSPAWVLLAAPLTAMFPISPENTAALGFLDWILMFAMWLGLWHCFGHRVAALSLLVACAQPFCFDYLVGSFLRWDWLFCLGLAACCLQLQKHRVAGLFFGFAVATKLFPIFFGLTLLLKVLADAWQRKKLERKYLDFLLGSVATGAVAVSLSAAFFGWGSWVEYAQRIQVAQVEKFYTIQYSLKTVYLQLAASDFNIIAQHFFPSALAQALPNVDIADHAVGFWAARLLFTGMVYVLVRRASDVEAFLMGPLLVFTWLTVNMYYWNMWGLFAIAMLVRMQRHQTMRGMLIGILVMNMFFYFHQHLNRALTEGYICSLSLSLIMMVTTFFEWRAMKRIVV